MPSVSSAGTVAGAWHSGGNDWPFAQGMVNDPAQR